MTISISEIIGLRKKFVALLNEPTFDKFCKSAGSLLILAGIIKAFFGFMIPVTTTDYNFIIFVFIDGVTLGIVGVIIKHATLGDVEREQERKKDGIKFDALIKNPKLKATEIQLDRMDNLLEEIDQIRVLLATVTKQQVNGIPSDLPTKEKDETNASPI